MVFVKLVTVFMFYAGFDLIQSIVFVLAIFLLFYRSRCQVLILNLLFLDNPLSTSTVPDLSIYRPLFN